MTKRTEATPQGSRPAPRGVLIAIEGTDGSGTTTQTERLVHELRDHTERGRLATRQPSNGPVGKLIREIVTGKSEIDKGQASERMMGLLFASDRISHCSTVVRPALELGYTVVSDRWYHSSYAYQGMWTTEVNQHEDVLVPDLTVFLRVSPELAASRRVAAGRAEEMFDDLKTQRRVTEGYEAAVRHCVALGQKVEVVDGSQHVGDVSSEVLRHALSAIHEADAGHEVAQMSEVQVRTVVKLSRGEHWLLPPITRRNLLQRRLIEPSGPPTSPSDGRHKTTPHRKFSLTPKGKLVAALLERSGRVK